MSSCKKLENVCPPIPSPLPPDDLSGAAKLMEAMGGKTPCYTDRSMNKTTAGAAIGLAAMGAGSSVSQKDISIGCEKIQAVAQTYRVAQRNIACTLNQSCNIVTNTIDANQIANFKCKGNIVINNLNQTQSVKLITSINLSDSEINDINNEMKTVNKQFAETLAESKTGYLGSSDGGKQASELKALVDNMDFKNTISQKILEFNNSIKTGQYINVEGEAQCIVLGEINQTQQVEMLATSMLNSSITNNFKSIMESINDQDSKTITKTEESDVQAKKSMYTTLIIGVIVFLVVLVVGFVLYKMFSKGTDSSEKMFMHSPELFQQMSRQPSYPPPSQYPPSQPYSSSSQISSPSQIR